LATLRRRGQRWHVQVRRKGRTPVPRSFCLKSDALAWAREQELEADQRRPQVHRTLKGIAFCASNSRQPICNNGQHPSSIVRTGRTKTLRRDAKGNRCLEVPRLSTHETVDSLQLLFFLKLGERPAAQKNTPNKNSPSLPAATPPAKPPGNDKLESGPG